MRLAKNKRASENWIPTDMPFLVLFVIVLGISLVALIIVINLFISRSTEIPKNIEEFILLERFYNSPNCFAYQDRDTGRIYSNLVDLEKFRNKDIMAGCFPTNNHKYSFKFQLENEETGKLTASTPNWIENSNFRYEQKNVLFYSDNKIKNAKLLIFIQDV